VGGNSFEVVSGLTSQGVVVPGPGATVVVGATEVEAPPDVVVGPGGRVPAVVVGPAVVVVGPAVVVVGPAVVVGPVVVVTLTTLTKDTPVGAPPLTTGLGAAHTTTASTGIADRPRATTSTLCDWPEFASVTVQLAGVVTPVTMVVTTPLTPSGMCHEGMAELGGEHAMSILMAP
jgi:hypothetical protein